MPLFEYEGYIIYISFEGKGKDATSRTMTFTKKTTVKLNIKMAECKNTDNRVWFIAGQVKKEQSLQIKHKDHRGGISRWPNCVEVPWSQVSCAV